MSASRATSGGSPRADAHWMRRALGLARRYAGRTWPNPTVGACLVRDGLLVADGVHRGAGENHAEVVVLEAARLAGRDPRGCTLYVTLEPCHHTGRTPPCSQALTDAGIARVVYAVDDRSPRHRGGGAEWLREAGVAVQRGPFTAEAWELNHPFFETDDDTAVHFTLKLAASLDGRIARRRGRVEDPSLRSITGEAVRRRVHRMRAGARAVLVGRRTVEFDRPRLDVREIPASHWEGPPPRPVVLDPRLALDPTHLPADSLWLHGPSASVADSSHRCLPVEQDESGHLDWNSVGDTLHREGLGVVLVEGGAEVARTLLEAGSAHRVHLFLAPRVLGGDGPQIPPVPDLEDRYETLRVRRVAQDIEWVLRRRDLAPPAR